MIPKKYEPVFEQPFLAEEQSRKEFEFQKKQSELIDKNLNRFETCCKDCIFAQYEGKTQTGCQFNKINKYRDLGVEILECYDNDKEFFVIKERLCNTCRNQSWSLKNETLEQAIIRVGVETQLKADVFVYLDKQIDSALPVIESITALSEQLLQPNEVVIINNSRGKIKSSFLIKLLNETNLKWSVESVADGDDSKLRALDIAIRKSKTMLNVLVNAGYKLQNDFLHKIDNAINQKLDKFIMIKPQEDDNGLVVLRKAYHLFNGNIGAPIQQKILEVAIETGETHLIKNYGDL